MNDNIPEFELGTILLSDPARVWNPTALHHHVNQLLREIAALGESQQWRRLTTLDAGLKATAQGLMCVLRLCPSAQAHLDSNFLSGQPRELAVAMLKERSHWLIMLQSAQWQLVGLRLARALSATAPFVEVNGSSSPESPPISAAMQKALEQLGRRSDKVHLRSEDSVVQFDLDGFGGYTWSDVVEIAGLPFRTSFGVRIELTRELRAGDFYGRQVQVRYEGLALPTQAMLDEATRHRSKLELRGRVGRRDSPASSPLVFQPASD